MNCNFSIFYLTFLCHKPRVSEPPKFGTAPTSGDLNKTTLAPEFKNGSGSTDFLKTAPALGI